jgi:hypothetical protein
MVRVSIWLVAAALACVPAVPVRAQMLGVPVLQNAFGNAGITIGADVGVASHAKGYGGAIAWSPASARFQVSAGGGVVSPDQGSTVATWGARVSVPVYQFGSGAFGVALFAGTGAASQQGVMELRVPAGATLGWRHALGAQRALSLYVTPFYSWARVSGGDATSSAGRIRISGGADFALFPGVGITAGVEAGSTAPAGDPGPSETVFGVGVSYALRHPR